jgi:type III secretion protein W
MGIQAREFSSQGLGSPNALRNLYRDITGNPRDAATLFNELSSAYPYEKMKTVINFLLHSMGADMKAKGPSISPGELARLLTDVRSMQGILGIYQFFKTRMRMILSEFKRAGLNLPPGVTFETLAKLLVKFLGERYPSVDKALKLLQQLGLPDRVIAQIIILMQLRDAIRQIAPKLFKDDRHRQDVLLSFMETLEELEEELEEDDNGKPKKDKKKG